MLALIAGRGQAQTALVEYDYDGMYQFIPKSMSSDGQVRLVTKSTEGSNGTAKVNITVYGSDFEQEKVISNNVRITSTGNTRTRYATRAVITEADSTDITSDIEERVSPDDMDGSVTEDDLMSYYSYYGEGISKTADGYYYSTQYGNKFYGESVFRERYPYYFVKLAGGKAYRVSVRTYTPDFTDSQWTSDSWTYYEDDMVCAFYLHDLDGDNEYATSKPLIVTQSLFNDDDKYEYVRTLRKAGATGTDGGGNTYVVYGEVSPIETEVTDKTVYGICGYEVVSEDGTVVFTIEIDDDDVTYYTGSSDNVNTMVVKMNGELYFIVTTNSYSSSEKNKLLVYKLDKATNGVKKIETSNDINISPRIVSKSQPVNITFSQAASAESSVLVTSLDGKIMAKRRVNAGEKSISINTARMATGLYNFTVLCKGKVVENGKVIVK